MMRSAGAKAIIAAALDFAHGNGLEPIAIAVLDCGGHVVAFERQDGCSLCRHPIAVAKARTAPGMFTDEAR